MLQGLLMMSGRLILMLVYGKEGFEKRKFGAFACIAMSAVVAFWLMGSALFFEGAAGNDTAICAVLAIGIPIAIAVWAIIARKNA